MGLLNYIIHGRKGRATELGADHKKILRIWATARRDYSKIEELARNFFPKNVRAFLENRKSLLNILNQIQFLISEELVEINDEIKTESELLEDLQSLSHSDRKDHAEFMISLLSTEYHNQRLILPIFEEIYNILKTALHVIRLLISKVNVNEEIHEKLLTMLSTLLVHRLGYLYNAFDRKTYLDTNASHNIHLISCAVLIGEELREEEKRDENAFIAEIIKVLGEGSDHYFRILGENIFEELSRKAWQATHEKDDDYIWLQNFEDLLGNDGVMVKLVQQYTKDSEKNRINLIITAFRKSFHLRHFEGFLRDFLQQQRAS